MRSVFEWRPDEPIDHLIGRNSSATVAGAGEPTAAVLGDGVGTSHWVVRARVADVLRAAAPQGCAVLVGYVWTPPGRPRRELRPDVVLHRRLGSGGRPSGSPVLCVEITDSRRPRRQIQGQLYAGLGVDHYWHVMPTRGAVEVFVRDGSEFRHAETLTGSADWVDFGIALAVLDVPALFRMPSGPASTR